MEPAANILHADLDSFYASVEQRDDSKLRGRPVIVGTGVALAASYEAKSRGVRTPMGVAAARRICPDAVVIKPRMSAYSDASKRVFAVLERFSPTVEGLSIDEAFLDVGGMEHFAGTPAEIGSNLRAAVLRDVGLPITVGIARTKFLAKVASGAAKPDGLLVVEPERELEFLHPLPIESLWGVGKVTSKKLHARGLHTVGDVAALRESTLVDVLGPASGHHLYALAHNRDPRSVKPTRRRRSIGAQRAIASRRYEQSELDTMLVGLVDRVAGRLRRSGRTTRTVVLALRFADFQSITRSHTLSRPTIATEDILDALRELLAGEMTQVEQRGISLIGVSLANLSDGDLQLELPIEDRPRDQIDATVDAVRDRFGKTAITRATLVGKDGGIAVPTLPD